MLSVSNGSMSCKRACALDPAPRTAGGPCRAGGFGGEREEGLPGSARRQTGALAAETKLVRAPTSQYL